MGKTFTKHARRRHRARPHLTMRQFNRRLRQLIREGNGRIVSTTALVRDVR